jgi:hypothetical protein
VSSTFPTTHTAVRKAHRCSICSGVVHITTRYERWRYFSSEHGSVNTIIVHPDCHQLFDDHGINEWHEGDTWSELIEEMGEPELKAALEWYSNHELATALNDRWDELHEEAHPLSRLGRAAALLEKEAAL